MKARHLFFLRASILVTALLICGFGCAHKQISQAVADSQAKYKQSKAQDDLKNQQQIDAAKRKAALDAAQAKADPSAHPFKAASQSAAEARKPLGVISLIGFVAFLVAVGLAFTPLSAISKIVIPIAGAVAGGSFAGVILLPFFPYVVGAGFLLLVGIAAYEIYRLHKKHVSALALLGKITGPQQVQLVHS